MGRVLVTGGTGLLGRQLVQRLDGRMDVRVLSRSPSDRPGYVLGDLRTGNGLDEAVEGVDVIAHCASAVNYRHPERDVEQTLRLLSRVHAAQPHLVYISIVGVDRIPFGYYEAKLSCEQMIEDSGLPYTIQRTTQFHDLALLFLQMMTKAPVALVPRGFHAQPVDVGEVADRMTELVLGEPSGRAPDMGGPRVEDAGELVRAYLGLTRRRRPIVHVPLPGKVAAAFRAGHHMVTADGTHGTRTFTDYLHDRVRPDGSVEPPYDLRNRR